ncbi:hypothetical protein [Pseudanabaena sp. Chao 1811]|uniref:hypothetical protein n=1 Tax=Pseudanabaena sp. Chao 1811 TaxID=2963092 RepID=UPI0022F3D118|nr:hypothetical protein [Pseudanabaena sp. Chao 1811]
MNSLYTSTVREYVESFSLFSIHHIFYVHATSSNPLCIDISIFDVVVTHYSIRLSFDWHLSSFYRQALKGYKGLKISFVQDEYDETETIRRSIEELGINILFTCVPEEFIEDIYPSSRFRGVKFIQTLTGWVPSNLENRNEFKPISERQKVISYRGRPLAYWYGDLGQEKVNIGKVVKAECEKRGISVDIEWDEDKRIYGDQWYTFLSNARATLGTESGSNVFDDYGEIRRNIKGEIDKNPAVTYEEIHQKYLVEHEGKVKMNQISPKMFEAIALKTALVLFEGSYSGILKSEVHYISLKKDFSNLDQVLAKLDNISYLEHLTETAFRDIILSGKYNYEQFILQFDDVIAQYEIQSKNVSGFTIQKAFEEPLMIDLLRMNELQDYILKVENSKFWKLRGIWMKFKNLVF